MRPAPLLDIADSWAIRLGGDKPRFLTQDEWYSLRRADFSLPAYPRKNVVVLTTGDRLPFDPKVPLRFEDDRLFFQPQAFMTTEKGNAIGVSLRLVAGLALDFQGNREESGIFQIQSLTEKRSQDLIVLTNGDRIEGSLKNLDPRGCKIQSKDRELTLPLESLAGIALNSDLLIRPKPKNQHVQLVLDGGARLSLASLYLAKNSSHLIGKTLFGMPVQIPLGELAALDVRQGRTVYLSELESVKYEHFPYLGLSWPLGKDITATGRQLFLGGSFFDRGIGMHSGSRLTCPLNGQYRWFEASVGLDPRFGTQGRVSLAIKVDKIPLDGKKEWTSDQSPFHIRLNVEKAKELTLEVNYAGFGDVQGHVNWIDARLVKI